VFESNVIQFVFMLLLITTFLACDA